MNMSALVICPKGKTMNEPERIGLDVMADIQHRTKLNHQAKVLFAVADFLQNRRKTHHKGRRKAKLCLTPPRIPPAASSSILRGQSPFGKALDAEIEVL
jgi:hypothetical protein